MLAVAATGKVRDGRFGKYRANIRLYAVSNLHLGYPANRRALERLRWYPNDWLILAGDIGEVGEHLDFALSMTTRRFARVMEVPGNHDLWSVGSDREFRGQSKYDYLGSICRVYGVLTPKDPYVRWPGDWTKIERTFRDGSTLGVHLITFTY